MNSEQKLMYTYGHLPQKLMHLSKPPKEITTDKYSDLTYLKGCKEMIEELDESDFDTRNDMVEPYSKDVLIKHFSNRIKELEKLDKEVNQNE